MHEFHSGSQNISARTKLRQGDQITDLSVFHRRIKTTAQQPSRPTVSCTTFSVRLSVKGSNFNLREVLSSEQHTVIVPCRYRTLENFIQFVMHNNAHLLLFTVTGKAIMSIVASSPTYCVF